MIRRPVAKVLLGAAACTAYVMMPNQDIAQGPAAPRVTAIRLTAAPSGRQSVAGGIVALSLTIRRGRVGLPPLRYLHPTPREAVEPLLPVTVAVVDQHGRAVRPVRLPATKLAPPRAGQFIPRGTITVTWDWHDWYSLQPGRYVFTFQYNFAANYPGLRSQWAVSEPVGVEIDVRSGRVSEVEHRADRSIATTLRMAGGG